MAKKEAEPKNYILSEQHLRDMTSKGQNATTLELRPKTPGGIEQRRCENRTGDRVEQNDTRAKIGRKQLPTTLQVQERSGPTRLEKWNGEQRAQEPTHSTLLPNKRRNKRKRMKMGGTSNQVPSTSSPRQRTRR